MITSQVTKKTGVQKSTLLWWEERGWITPRRKINPYHHKTKDRHYSADDIIRIKILRLLSTQIGKNFCINLLLKPIKRIIKNEQT